MQRDALAVRWPEYASVTDELSPEILVFLMATVPKMMLLEDSVGISDADAEGVRQLVELYLESVEPMTARPCACKAKPRTKIATPRGGSRSGSA